jgi:hypothetical protein
MPGRSRDEWQERIGGQYLGVSHFLTTSSSTSTAPCCVKAFSKESKKLQVTSMATHPISMAAPPISRATYSIINPFPRTPYPFDQLNADNINGLASISEWLELPEQSEECHAESNALTPDDWIALDGQEDSTWVVGEPDWLEEATQNAEPVPGGPLETESSSCSTDTTASLADLYSPQDTLADPEESHEQAVERTLSLYPPSPRGVVRRRDSEEELQLPERKRPRLGRCMSLNPAKKTGG